jgi:hypothetical protein
VVLALVPSAGEEAADDAAITVAYGMAVQLGFKVLVVDARVDDCARADHTPGLLDVLRGEVPLAGLVRALDLSVDLLPRGSGVVVLPSLMAAGLSAFLGQVGSSYGAVVMLTDPVTVSMSARVVARLAHKTLLLAREDRTLMRELERSREILIESLVSDIELVFDRPATDWRENVIGPIRAFLLGACRGARRFAVALGARLKSRRVKPKESPAPAARPSAEPSADRVASAPGQGWMPQDTERRAT